MNGRLSLANIALSIILILTACVPLTPPGGEPTPTPDPPTATLAPPTDTSAPPTATSVPPTDTPEPTATPDVLSLDPVRIEFNSADGTPLIGYYYPAGVETAPVIVLMHWAGGTQCDWLAVNLVQWLQNRGLPEGVAANPACANAEILVTAPLDLYPSLPEGSSYAVFTFDLRGFGESGGDTQVTSQDLVDDSIAGVQIARTLPGVDPNRVTTMGASIGADGAIDGCGDGCLGALSFSPGNYYDILYRTAVETLEVDQKPAWCLAATGDRESFPTCDNVQGDYYTKIIYEGERAHAMRMFDPEFKFKMEFRQSIVDYLNVVFVN